MYATFLNIERWNKLNFFMLFNPSLTHSAAPYAVEDSQWMMTGMMKMKWQFSWEIILWRMNCSSHPLIDGYRFNPGWEGIPLHSHVYESSGTIQGDEWQVNVKRAIELLMSTRPLHIPFAYRNDTVDKHQWELCKYAEREDSNVMM